VKITFLGTGTSQGVPLIGCKCKVCVSKNIKDKRLRTALHIATKYTSIVIDTGPDFRQQMLQNKIKKLDAVLFTHNHKDHVAGLDDIRAFNYILQKSIDVYANKLTQKELKREFPYIFNGTNYPGIPQLNMNTISKKNSFQIGDIHIQPIEVMHYKLPVLGFRFNNKFTYITDANYIAPIEFKKIIDSEVLVLNALRNEKHISHFSLTEAMQIATEANAKQTYFTHASHQLGKHEAVNKTLPNNMHLAHDGLCLHL
jgi:phosphoribosyl 1,2-cyclic phosphate phosphodiesterase